MGRTDAQRAGFGARIRAMFERLRVDLVSATRSLSATPVPVVAAIVTLAVAVGVNLAMFGLIDRALLSPAEHVSNPERLFTIGIVPPGAKPGGPPMTTTSKYSSDTVIDRTSSCSSSTTTLVALRVNAAAPATAGA